MLDNHDECILCTRKAECFKYLSNDELKLFHDSKTTIRYRKGETIIKQGTEFTHVISFNAGLAKMSVEVAPNQNVLIGILKPSEILGGPGMFANNKYSFSVTALTEAKICMINVEIFKKVIRLNPDFSEEFLATFSQRFVEAINRLVNITYKQMHGRVADALFYLSDEIYKSNTFDLDLSRQELAEFTGMSKESISRIFKDLIDEKIIKSTGRHIEILNREKLEILKVTG